MIAYMLNKIASIQFWWVDRTVKLDRDYKYLLEDSDIDAGGFRVELLKKPYQGIIVEYRNIKIEEDKYGTGLLLVDTNVVANPNNLNLKTKAFNKLVTNIVRLILIHSMKAIANEHRDVDFVEFDEERGVREEDPAVSEGRVSKRKPRKKAVRRNSKSHPKV